MVAWEDHYSTVLSNTNTFIMHAYFTTLSFSK
jgi:hypothetical protein